ncbi:Aste57867_10718 [Aphanomyces stellatus]|uniref:Aste57867_10718 protein n=1 Tax=Aphanomyces stellatus TaxID=120398 RepID=A0A485KSP7_9STRA|nr:hypothetical protein As57867_010678 [Aphanomyces stellatus]VFT87588.1 Aste57867_10718 [Aphanomyces stellatus]
MWQVNRSASTRMWESIRARLQGDSLLSSAELDMVLAQILTLPMPPARLRTDEVGSTLAALARVLPPKSELLVSDFTGVIRHCCKDKLHLTGDQLDALVPFLVSALTYCPSWYTEQILTTLSVVLLDNADRAVAFHDHVFATVAPVLDPTSADAGARYAATNCMAHIVSASHTPTFGPTLWRLALDNFVQQTRQLHNDTPHVVWTTNRMHYKSCIASMQCLLPMLRFHDPPTRRQVDAELSNLLVSLRHVLGCGLIFTPSTMGRLPLSDSDSDATKRGIGLAARLRLLVVRMLDSVLQLSPATITSSLGLYLADTTSPYLLLYDGAPSLLSLVVCDPYDQVRVQVLKWLESVWGLVNLRAVLSQNFKASSSAFTTSGTATLSMVYQTHLVLLHNLQHEHDPTVLVQTLKTTTSLVSVCPYANMVVSYRSRAMTPPFESILQATAAHVHGALYCSEHTVRVAALACLAALLGTSDSIACLLEWLPATTHAPVATPSYHLNAPALLRLRPRSFLEEMLAQAKTTREATASLHRLDAMSLLSKTAKNYASSLSLFWPRLAEFLLVAFRDVDQNVRLQAVKILENYIKGEDKTTFHLDFMATHLVRAFQDPSHHVRASVCACFTLLRPPDWARFAPTSFLTQFVATPNDASPVVRAAGFRLLGALALVPSFKTPMFITKVVTMGMTLSKDSTLNVRVRVVWAIGNACTTPGPEAPEEPDSPWLIRLLTPKMIDQVLQCMLDMVDDNDKVASSVVRTMGLLTRWLVAPAYLEQTNGNLSASHALLAAAMTILAKKVLDGAPKVSGRVRWNACHAMAKVFHCPVLPLASASWTPAVFTSLTTAIAQQDNFKVRISAAMALRISCARISYGLFYPTILQTILDALDSAVELADISEYKYKAQLELQLSFTLVHLVALANAGDEKVLGEMLCGKYKDFIYDWLYHQQHKMYAAIFGDERVDDATAEEGHEVNPVSCAQVVDACDVLRRVIQTHCPHTASCLAQIAEVKLIFEMDMLEARGFEF